MFLLSKNFRRTTTVLLLELPCRKVEEERIPKRATKGQSMGRTNKGRP